MQNIFFSLAFLLIAGCSNGSQTENSPADKAVPDRKTVAIDSNFIKVYVEQTGAITANGNIISLKDLDSAFSRVKMANGVVYYSRANGQGEPPPESMKVLDLVIKYGLPITLYTDKTFTQIVKPD